MAPVHSGAAGLPNPPEGPPQLVPGLGRDPHRRPGLERRGSVLLDAVADANAPGGSGNKPQVTATWSASAR